MCRGMVRETKRFLSGIRRAVGKADGWPTRRHTAKRALPAQGKGWVSRLSVVLQKGIALQQQSPFGAVREANCLERAPLCRQFLKKASYSRHSPLPPQPEPF